MNIPSTNDKFSYDRNNERGTTSGLSSIFVTIGNVVLKIEARNA